MVKVMVKVIAVVADNCGVRICIMNSVANWEEDVDNAKHVDRTVTGLLSPGARYAFNLPNDAQLVVGVAMPIGITSDAPDYGLFFYCSFEHLFTRVNSDNGK